MATCDNGCDRTSRSRWPTNAESDPRSVSDHRPGVARGVDLAEPVDGHQRVDLGGGPEAWPSSSWTTRTSAPPSSRCVARCRRVCGDTADVSPPHPPARSAAAQRIDQALCRERSPAGVEEQRPTADAAATLRGQGRPGADEAILDRAQGVAADRDDPLLAALACQAHHRLAAVHVVSQPPPPRRCARRCRRGARAAPGRAGLSAPPPCRPPRSGRPPTRTAQAAAAPGSGSHLRGDVTDDQAVEQREPVRTADGDHRPRGRGRRQRGVVVVAGAQGGQEPGVGLRHLPQGADAGRREVADVAAQVPAVGGDGVRGQTALDGQVVQ